MLGIGERTREGGLVMMGTGAESLVGAAGDAEVQEQEEALVTRKHKDWKKKKKSFNLSCSRQTLSHPTMNPPLTPAALPWHCSWQSPEAK